MTMPRSRRWGLRPGALVPRALFAALLLGCGSASAQSADDKAAADALFDAARKAMDSGDYATACPKFADSQQLDPGVGTLLNLARCFDLSGKTGSAYSTYREAAAMARAEGQEEREAFARQEVDRLEPKLTRLVVEVNAEVRAVQGVAISRAGKVLPQSMWGVAFAVDPGPQEIEVSAPGYQPVRASVDAQGEGKTILLTVPPLTPAAPPPAQAQSESLPPEDPSAQETAPATTSPEDTRAGTGPGPMPWILGGVGLAAVGVGTAFALMGLGENNQAKEICTSGSVCPGDDITAWWDARNAAQTDYTVAYVSWGVGAAALIGSTVWLLVGSKPGHATRLQVRPVATERVWGVVARGAF